ncbi:MAG: hypothetical protein HY291_10400 [Planctomycetes bacterium]|nr:hypothetical protein [Planctomycetota bacterium]
MAIIVHCKNCGKKNRASDAAAGKLGRCAGCGQTMRIPAAAAEEGISDDFQDAPTPPPAPAIERAPQSARKAAASPARAKASPASARNAPVASTNASTPMRGVPSASAKAPAASAKTRTPKAKPKRGRPFVLLAAGAAALLVAGGVYFVFFRHKITLQKPAQLEDFSDEPSSGTPTHRPAVAPPPAPGPASVAQAPLKTPPATPGSEAKTAAETKSASDPALSPAESEKEKTVAPPPSESEKTTIAETPKPPSETEKTAAETAPPPDETGPFVNDKPGLLFQPPEGTTLSVRLDFFWPNDGKIPDAQYFAVGAERDRRFPWSEILLVDARPNAANGANSKIQIRAKVRGLKALIEKGDPHADRFPVRIYRTFMNDLDDGEEIYANALAKLHGAAPKDSAGKVKEPDGRRLVLKRIKELAGEDAVFVSGVIDIGADKDLNPMKSAQPPPPSFAASDGDVYYTQMHAAVGDEEPDAWAFGQAMKALGFVSAGVAHPNSKRFAPEVRGAQAYQFSLSVKELLNLRTSESWEDLSDPAAIEQTRKLLTPGFVAGLRERLKNMGASKVAGRPVTNGAFLVSTGVQKLVVTAMGANKPGETAWRFPGVVHVTDGWMDQCLVRAPASIYFYSGHGWNVSNNGKAYALINLYPKDNLAAFHDETFCMYVASYLPGNRWLDDTPALEENKVILSEKWKKDELRLQWLFLVGCDVLQADGDPFRKWDSNCGTFGTLALKQLGLKGVVGFSEHGFTSASLLKRFAERAATTGIATEWMRVFRDTEARAYTWYETNESFGRSKLYTYQDLLKKVPAYLIRRENLGDKLTPESLQLPVGKDTLEFYELKDAANRKTGVMSE